MAVGTISISVAIYTGVVVVMMLRNGYRLWIVMLLVVASWQLGQGVYIQAKALLAQELLEHAWTDMQNGGDQVTPWSWADTWPVARLTVPRLDVDLLVLAGDSGRTLAFGPGHNFASAMPGEQGNSIISGHRDTHFRFLKHLRQGDRIIIEPVQGQPKIYVVNQQSIVDAQQGYISFDNSRSSINLITCYPFDSINPGATRRFIVSAEEQQPVPNINI